MNIETAERELQIEVAPGLDCWQGTAQQLREEGLLPDGIDLPAGRHHRHWEADGFCFWLRRVRPAGFKGPMRAWIAGDYWRLERTNTVATQAQQARFLRLVAANRDEHFQAFLRLTGQPENWWRGGRCNRSVR